MWQSRDFSGAAVACRTKSEAVRALAAELDCPQSSIVTWTHPDRDTERISLPDADGGEPWMERVAD